MCFNSSSSSAQSSEQRDERIGADNGGTAFRAEGENHIVVGSDETAQMAIESSTNALLYGTNFVSDALTQFFNSTDAQLDRADRNLQAGNALTADLLKQEQEGSDERLIGLIKMGLIAGVSIYALKSGFITETVKAFK